MARNDGFKKAQAVGADFLETARARAEEFLRELARASGGTQEQARGAFDELLDNSRKGTESLLSAMRGEIANQLRALGLATKADLDDLERRLTGRVSAAETTAARAAAKQATTPAPAAKAPSTRSTARRTAARTTADATKTTAQKTTTRKAPAKKASAAKKTAG